MTDQPIPKDKLGREIQLGDTVAWATLSGQSAVMKVCRVTKINDKGRVYLDGARNCIMNLNRVIVLVN